MLELNSDRLAFSFPEVHLGAQMSLALQRTLRIPDDDKDYPLPPGLGNFPLQLVDQHKDRAPQKWLDHGGVMLPMYQSEALWIQFHGHYVPRQGQYPFAVKIAAGKVSALTGDEWQAGLQPKDYAIIPNQRWIDGYVIEEGLVRQFVAAPLGSGFSAEEQITGKAQYGGIQIEVFPMKAEVFNRRFPIQPVRDRLGGGIIRSAGMSFASAGTPGATKTNSTMDWMETEMCRSVDGPASAAVNADMGLAAGGKMKQQIFEDPYGIDDWDTEHGSRCFIHLANSMVWKVITRKDPPFPPATAADYSAHGLPWFDYYTDDWKSLVGTGKLKGLKTLMQLGFQKGVQVLPENQPVDFKSDQVHQLGDKKRPNEVRAGSW